MLGSCRRNDDRRGLGGSRWGLGRCGCRDWAQEARLEPDLSRDFLYFGWALALEGDLLVVGARVAP